MTEYTEEFAGVLAVQLYSADACRSIVEYANEVNAWMEAKVSERAGDGGFNPVSKPEARSASVLALSRRSRIGRDFDEKMENIIKPLVGEVWRVPLRQHSETHFVRYTQGHYYTPHSDTGLHRGDRYFTLVCYLNDDFTGGYTSFPRLNYSVIPRSGKAIIFPATYIHCAESVVSGEKYVLISWLTGKSPIRWI